jgi:GNAT superfamily N-acetyltransferase
VKGLPHLVPRGRGRDRAAGPSPEPPPGETALVAGDIDDGLHERLDREIRAFNAQAAGHWDGQLLRIAVRQEGGALVAGLSGWTWGGCGYLDLVWVRAGHRGDGLGGRLLTAAEEEIRRRGCDLVALTTYTFQAPGFYLRAGYRECGRTPDFPPGHDQIHLVKRLS